MATSIRLISLFMFIAFALCTQTIRVGVGASPTIDPASSPKPNDITGKTESVTQTNGQQHVTDNLLATQSGPPPSASSSQQQVKSHGQVAPVTGAKPSKANNAEKLKRGLTNFMNHLNPAPYFVPTQLVGTSSNSKTAAAASAEPATLVNHGASADVLIKGPSRLVQARPIGGPLRWGRR